MEFRRQVDIFNPLDYEDVNVHVIGAGGIGSFTAIALAKLGLARITVWDGDVVEEHNVPNQFFKLSDVGRSKVEALADIIEELTGTKVEAMNRFWSTDDVLNGIVIAAVDSMGKDEEHEHAGRKEIWEHVKKNIFVPLYIDGRIGGETIRILAIRPINDAMHHKWYEKNLFSNAEGSEQSCTARSIIDVGFMVASVVTNIVRRYLKNDEVVRDTAISMADLTIVKFEV